MPKFFQTISGPQWLTMVIVPILVVLVNTFIPPGPMHDAILAVVVALGGQTLVSTRIPSTQGGTTKAAATIAPGSIVVEPSIVSK